MKDPNLVKTCLHRTCRNCFSMQDEGLYNNTMKKRDKQCPMCKEKIGTNRKIIRDERMKEMIAMLLGFHQYADRSTPKTHQADQELNACLDKFNKMIAIQREKKVMSEFDFKRYADDMRRKQREQEIKIIKYIESIDGKNARSQRQ